MKKFHLLLVIFFIVVFAVTGCGGSGSGGGNDSPTPTPTPTNGELELVVTPAQSVSYTVDGTIHRKTSTDGKDAINLENGSHTLTPPISQNIEEEFFLPKTTVTVPSTVTVSTTKKGHLTLNVITNQNGSQGSSFSINGVTEKIFFDKTTGLFLAPGTYEVTILVTVGNGRWQLVGPSTKTITVVSGQEVVINIEYKDQF